MAPSLADAGVFSAPDGMSLPATLLQTLGQLTRTKVIYAYLFRENSTGVGKFADFVEKIKEEEQMLLDNVPQDATLRPHVPYLLVRWVYIRFSN